MVTITLAILASFLRYFPHDNAHLFRCFKFLIAVVTGEVIMIMLYSSSALFRLISRTKHTPEGLDALVLLCPTYK